MNEAGLDIAEIKLAYRIPAAWRDLQLDGAPGKCVCSPFRQDKNPSFSVYADGRRFRDFGTNETGDILDFVARATETDIAGALRWIQQRLGFIDCRSGAGKSRKPRSSELRFASPDELSLLNVARGFSIEGMKLAQARGFLRFCTYFKQAAWCISDKRRELFEFRRLDGKPWPAYKHLAERKSHCVGAGKRWPLGTREAEGFKNCALVEGAPDFLALFNFLVIEAKDESCAPLAVLGGSNVIDAEALKLLTGRHVRLYPHLDQAGQRAAYSWAQQLVKAGCRVDAFNFKGLMRADGTAGKDLGDLLLIDPDCWERTAKFHQILP